MSMTKAWDTFTYIVGGLIVAIVIFSFPHTISRTTPEAMANVLSSTSQPSTFKKDYFASTTLLAKAAYVYDIQQQKVLFAKNQNQILPLASLTKIMMAITAEDLASSTASTTRITISEDDLKQDGDTGLLKEEHWLLNDLLAFTLVQSSNDGASAIATAFTKNNFIKQMNDTALQLHLYQTSFLNESGLDISTTTPGATGSAHDVAQLLLYGIKQYPSIFNDTRYARITMTSLDNIAHFAQNTNTLISYIPSLIAGKTGYTDLAGGNLAIMFDAAHHHPVVMVVLGSTYDGRFSDMKKLVNQTIVAVMHQ